MDFSNMKIEFGIPGKGRSGYGVTKKQERFPGEAVMTMEPHIVEEGKKATRKFTFSKEALIMLGLKGKAFQATEEFPRELLYTVTFQDDGGKVEGYGLANTTSAPEEMGIRDHSFNATKSGGFSNKPLYDALIEHHGLTENEEYHFNLSLVEGDDYPFPIVTIALRREENDPAGHINEADPGIEQDVKAPEQPVAEVTE